VLAVLYLNGARYVMGPVRDWPAYLRGIESALGDNLELVEHNARRAFVCWKDSGRPLYRLEAEPWPREVGL
jgi:hypothetical protein